MDEKIDQISPIVPAVKPTIKKNANSVKSLGKELTIKLSWSFSLVLLKFVYFSNLTKKKFF